MDVSYHDLLMTRAADELSMIRWLNTQDGARGINRPGLLLPELLKKDKRQGGKYTRETPEEFMEAYYGERNCDSICPDPADG